VIGLRRWLAWAAALAGGAAVTCVTGQVDL